jgi:hypothetical protein
MHLSWVNCCHVSHIYAQSLSMLLKCSMSLHFRALQRLQFDLFEKKRLLRIIKRYNIVSVEQHFFSIVSCALSTLVFHLEEDFARLNCGSSCDFTDSRDSRIILEKFVDCLNHLLLMLILTEMRLIRNSVLCFDALSQFAIIQTDITEAKTFKGGFHSTNA